MINNYFDSRKWYWIVPYIKKIPQETSKLPFTLRIDLTTKCNFNCPFCLYMSQSSVISKNSKYHYPHTCELNHENLLRVISLFAQRGLKSIILTGGGEPFKYPLFSEVLELLLSRKIEVGIITNGTQIDSKFIRKYYTNEYCKWIRISLDSATKKTWIKMHKPKDESSFEEVVNNIKLLTSNKRRHHLVAINFLVTPLNYKEIIAAFRLARKLNVDNIRFTPVFTKIDKRIYKNIKNEIDQQLKQVITKTKPLVQVNLPRFEFHDSPNVTKRCWFSFFSVNLGIDSNLYPCCLKKYVKGMGTPLNPKNFDKNLKSYFDKMNKFNAKSCSDCMYHKFNIFGEHLHEDGVLDHFVP